MPLKVMIVDDEILAIQDLENLIPWGKNGFQIVATAVNSLKALELYQKLYPQIIFIDIRMPMMDGLQLSQRILSLGHPVKIILVTAYRDFDYAKRAVEIGVSNYLLKHDINAGSVLQELNKISLELAEELEKRRIIRQRFLHNIIEGRAIAAGIGQKETMVYETPDSDFALILAVQNRPFLEQFQDQNHPSIGELHCDPLNLPEYVRDYDILPLNENLLFIFILKKTNSHLETREREFFLGNLIQAQINNLSTKTKSFTVIVTPTCSDKTGLAILYQKAVTILPYLVFYGHDQIIHSDDVPPSISSHDFPQNQIDNILLNLSNSLNDLDPDLAARQLNELFKEVALPVWSPDAFKKVCNQLLYLLEHFQKQNQFPSIFEKYAGCAEGSCAMDNVQDLHIWFLREFSEALQQVKAFKCPSFSKKTQQAIQYIREHYSEDLTVDKVAENLGFSGVYLSQIFKKDTQKTFLEYLTDYRIEIAKHLLQTGDYKVYEVAEIVGYKTSQYFSQVFRKITGIYPIDYRERGTNE